MAQERATEPGPHITEAELRAANDAFWYPSDLEALARQQGVKPIEDPKILRGDFWPEDEDVDEFIATVRGWRSESG